MAQSNSSNAPPPASEEDIRSLEKKMVDKYMLGTGGKAEGPRLNAQYALVTWP